MRTGDPSIFWCLLPIFSSVISSFHYGYLSLSNCFVF
jgi:hypothetical protein